MIRPQTLIADVLGFEDVLRDIPTDYYKKQAVLLKTIDDLERLLQDDFDNAYFTDDEIDKIKGEIELADMLLLVDAPGGALDVFWDLRNNILGKVLVRHLVFPSRLVKDTAREDDLGTLYDLPDLVKHMIVNRIIEMM